jgi:hypothetical protein
MSRQHTEAHNGTEHGMEVLMGHDEVGYTEASKPLNAPRFRPARMEGV